MPLAKLDKQGVKQFCELLNSTEHPELKDRLRQLVKRWQESGPNLLKMMGIKTMDTDCALSHLFTVTWMPVWQGRRAMLGVTLEETQLKRLCGGRRILTTKPDGRITTTPEAKSWVAFGYFTLNPYCEELAGPCARCGNYYVKKRRSQKVYCSRRCGSTATAIANTKAKRKAERKRKIIRAKALIQEWNTLKDRSGRVWKVWLKKQEPGITEKFVTRRVRLDELPKPKTGSKP